MSSILTIAAIVFTTVFYFAAGVVVAKSMYDDFPIGRTGAVLVLLFWPLALFGIAVIYIFVKAWEVIAEVLWA